MKNLRYVVNWNDFLRHVVKFLWAGAQSPELHAICYSLRHLDFLIITSWV